MTLKAPRVWFITGSSTGFGRLMTQCVLRNGDKVAATLRKPAMLADLAEQFSPDQLLVLKLDVTNHQEILDTFTEAGRHFGRIDVVFNNAGYALLADVEGATDEAARAVFEVNFWGAVNVSKEAVRWFREENKPSGGRLLQNSSVLGFTPDAGIPFYVASKFALEGLSESFASSLDPAWNIKITLIEPGWFRTDVLSSNMDRSQVHPAYVHLPAAKYHKHLDGNPLVRGDTEKAVEVIYAVADLPDPPVRFPLGRDCNESFRKQIAKLTTIMDQYGSWSDELDVE
ncbi:hypothetical protein IEO21_09163 [Rhodonia placenta]|uniref:NAD-P-binding protein n=1 Tax=Rhodonia placenta TaxID=104341 RepID=A0A8H7NUY3_9APHY|nr:hypothetical protein IEO21_09163 [Postia placenta]